MWNFDTVSLIYPLESVVSALTMGPVIHLAFFVHYALSYGCTSCIKCRFSENISMQMKPDFIRE
jgi:hypothetical protein